jgi:hypothetical protein
MLLFIVTPLELLIVRSLRFDTLEGMLIPEEDPPKIRLEEEVVIRFAGVPVIAGPLRVSV